MVIGGGPGGIEAAATAAAAGADVTLVSDGPVGGRAGWHSLLPSKIWLSAVESHGGNVSPQDVLLRLQQVREEWSAQQAARLAQLGARVLPGTAAFSAPQVVTVTHSGQTSEHSADHVIIAAGSVPVFPPSLKPDGRRVIAPRFMSDFTELPRSIVVVGAGSTGCEFAHLFAALGVEVTWIVDSYGVLPAYHPRAGELLAESMAKRGVVINSGATADRIERGDDGVVVVLHNGEEIGAEMAFVAIGRRPDLDRLDLARAGLPHEPQPADVDGYGRSSNPAVYLIGDAAGAPMVANKAMVQGRIAARHALGLPVEPYDPRLLIWATYTAPEVAQVGEVVGHELEISEMPYAQTLKPWLVPPPEGEFWLSYAPQSGRLAGALAIGPHAADLLAPVLLGLRLGATVSDLTELFGAHPTMSELPFAAARGR